MLLPNGRRNCFGAVLKSRKKDLPWACGGITALLVLLIFLVPPSLSALPSSQTRSKELREIRRIAILPLVNYTDEPDAADRIEGLLREGLRRRGMEVATQDEVDAFLALKRIRYTGGITRLNAREMGKVLGVEAILLGSVNLYADMNGEVYTGVTLRLISTADGEIVWTKVLSYSGRDFEGILGLGLVTSLEELSRRVVVGLLEELPRAIPIDDSKIRPFEIERVEVYPEAVRGGDKVEVRVKFHSFVDRPVEIKARIGDVEALLRPLKMDEYGGFIQVPQAEGVHLIDVIASYGGDLTYEYPAVGKAVVDNTPPVIDIKVSREIFAPRRKGYVMLRPRLLSYERIEQWEIRILDEMGRVVRSDKGYGKLPKGLIWRGEDNRFQMVEDGRYTYRFAAMDSAGNIAVLSGTLRVKNRPPSVDISIEEGEDRLIFNFDYNPDEAIKEWEVVLLSPEGKQIKVIRGKGDLPRRLEYPLVGSVDVKRLSFAVDVRDRAGNHFRVTRPVSMALIKKTPFAERKKVLKDF